MYLLSCALHAFWVARNCQIEDLHPLDCPQLPPPNQERFCPRRLFLLSAWDMAYGESLSDEGGLQMEVLVYGCAAGDPQQRQLRRRHLQLQRRINDVTAQRRNYMVILTVFDFACFSFASSCLLQCNTSHMFVFIG